MTFKDAITQECEAYASNPAARFIGYNTVFGSRMYGTLNGVAADQCVEAPVAENLMAGLAMGMALEGYLPVLCFERHDFILLALDAIVNQMDKMPLMSGGQFKWPIVVRAIVGSNKPIDPGPMHSQDYTVALRSMLKHSFVLRPRSIRAMKQAWSYAGQTDSGVVVIVEHKDDYSLEMPI